MPACQMLVPLRFFSAGYGPVAKSTVPCFLNSCYFHRVGFPLWYAPAVPRELGGGHNANLGGHAKKKFPALCAGVCAPPQLQNRVGAYGSGAHKLFRRFLDYS